MLPIRASMRSQMAPSFAKRSMRINLEPMQLRETNICEKYGEQLGMIEKWDDWTEKYVSDDWSQLGEKKTRVISDDLFWLSPNNVQKG